MIDCVHERLDSLRALCQRFCVGRLDLFGSAARGSFSDESSDLDFFVEFVPDSYDGASDRYFGLLEGLESLFQRRIDLVEIRACRNPYFLAEASKHRTNLYAA